MPTEREINQSFLKSLVASFTEHPEALRVLLENRPLNDALAAYLNAAAERLRPEQKWKEIYTLRGDEKRRYTHDSSAWAYPGVTTASEVVAMMRLYYDPQMRVAIAYGGITHAVRDFALYQGYSFIIPDPLRKVQFFDDEAPAIAWAQDWFSTVQEWVNALTSPIEEADAASADQPDA